MAIWDGMLTERDRELVKARGPKARGGFGKKPALVIIDVNYDFVGDRPEPVVESVKRFPLSCGEDGWKAVHQIASLLAVARERRVPVVYSTGDLREMPESWRSFKSARRQEVHRTPETNAIVREIAPATGDIVINKLRPSVFFGTPLLAMLNSMQVDTLLMCGCVTSGCVRASVVDGFSYGYRVAIVQECTFDRFEASHRMSLFDLNLKYADVIAINEATDYLKKL